MDKQEFKRTLNDFVARGLTVDDIAKKVPASRGRVNGWLHGKGAPLDNYSDKIVNVLQEELKRRQARGSK